MATFRYRAYGLDGGFAEGTIEAATTDAATDILWARGLTPFQLRPTDGAGTRWWNRELFSVANSHRADLLAFTREFAMLNTAEIPLDDALRILRDQASSQRLRNLVEGLRADVLNGLPLSDAMLKQPKVFPADYVAVVRAGEIGGALSNVLVELAELLERRAEIRSRIQSALVYPAMLVLLGLGTAVIIVGSLIPSIAPIFSQSGKPLPTTIRMMMAIQENWFELLVGAGAVVVALAGTMLVATRKPSVRLALDRFRLRLPVLGSFLIQQDTARFTRTLGTMLKAGVPLSQATRSACDVVGNRHMMAGITRAIEAVHQGAALHRALREETVLPAIALQMISVGEEAGKLDRMLSRVAVMLERQLQSSIDRFMSALAPALTVGIALMVGALIMPVMNAVLSINDLAAR
jgi:general secretion pathway protein F